MKKLLLAALAACSSVYAGDAQVNITQIQATLVDLNLNDGIDPSITIGQPGGVAQMGLDFQQSLNYLELNQCNGHCEMAPDYTSLALSVPASEFSDWASARAGYRAIDPFTFNHFALSPHTSYTLDVSYLLSLVGQGSASIDLNGQWAFRNTSGSETGLLSYTWTNETDEPLWFNYTVVLSASTNNIAAVPEPDTYALLLLGLAGCAGWRRAKRTHSGVQRAGVAVALPA
jgi:hypothetical protein